MTLYLVISECGICWEEARHVEETEEPVALDQDVEVTADYCPECGGRPVDWYPVEEAEIERVTPTQERGDR